MIKWLINLLVKETVKPLTFEEVMKKKALKVDVPYGSMSNFVDRIEALVNDEEVTKAKYGISGLTTFSIGELYRVDGFIEIEKLIELIERLERGEFELSLRRVHKLSMKEKNIILTNRLIANKILAVFMSEL